MAATPAPHQLPPAPARPAPWRAVRARIRAMRDALPQGRTLPDEEFDKRHRVLLTILWLHALVLPLYAVGRGLPAGHALLEGVVVAAPAALATLVAGDRKRAGLVVAFGLMTSSAVLVHIAEGLIEAHFHFFVVIVLLTLYEEWLPFLLAVAYVLLHHGVGGVLAPEMVYDHPSAVAQPWAWAAVHTAFVAAAASGAVAAWRLNEDVRERALRAEAEAARYAAELERSNRDLQDFASVASHDLREPLRTVAGFVALLERRHGAELPPEAQGFLRHALDGTGRMQQLIDDLLAWSRAGSAELDVRPVELRRIVDDVVADLGAAITSSRATVEIGLLPVVAGDARQLRHVIQNLLSNALKFHGDRPPRVWVDAEPAGPSWVVRVADAGIGIPPEHADRVFGMFQRAHDRSHYEGTGIGLAICARIAERHGGSIAVAARHGGGTVFSVTLPAG